MEENIVIAIYGATNIISWDDQQDLVPKTYDVVSRKSHSLSLD